MTEFGEAESSVRVNSEFSFKIIGKQNSAVAKLKHSMHHLTLS